MAVRIRRLEAIGEREIEGLSDVLIDCVEGGASVSFMLPMTREKAEAYWRSASESVARGERFVLAAEDTTVDAMVTDMGKEMIRWGAKPVQARKLRIGDTTSEFFAMVGPQGYMLQLLQPSTGLRVVRKAQDVKPPGSR